MAEWDDLGGRRGDVWDGLLDAPCPCCKAQEGEKCVNKLTGNIRRLPCVARLQKAQRSPQ